MKCCEFDFIVVSVFSRCYFWQFFGGDVPLLSRLCGHLWSRVSAAAAA